MKSITIRLLGLSSTLCNKTPLYRGFCYKVWQSLEAKQYRRTNSEYDKLPSWNAEDTRIDRFDPDHLAVTRFAREHGNHQLLSPFSTVTCSVVFIPAATILSRARRFTSI
jgi:hypothetical protein